MPRAHRRVPDSGPDRGLLEPPIPAFPTRPTRPARRTRLAVAGVVAAVALLLSGCASAPGGSWFRSPGHGVHIAAAGPCPSTLPSAQDVANPQPSGPSLLPRDELPVSGLLCVYSPTGQSAVGLVGAPPKTGYRLKAEPAILLAQVVGSIPLGARSSIKDCPPTSSGSTSILSFRYPHHADVNLWYSTSGCQRLDNGVLAATSAANTRQFAELAWFVSVLTLNGKPT